MTTLIAALEAFDGKAVSILSEARKRFEAQPGFYTALVRLAADDAAHISEGATWLIKDCLSTGGSLSAGDVDVLLGHVSKITAWQAQLHICQSFEYLQVPPVHADAVFTWLQPLLIAKRPFLRAWSMDALQHLSRRSGLFEAQALTARNRAKQDDAASVRARARKWL